MRTALLVIHLFHLWVGFVVCTPGENGTHTSPHHNEHHTAMDPWGLGITMDNFIILSVVIGILILVLIGLMIACCVYCCKSNRSSWSDLHKVEIEAGLTPSLVDKGMTLSRIDKLQPQIQMIPAAPAPPVSPLGPYVLPPAILPPPASSDKHVTLKEGVLLPKELIGVKPKGNNRRNRKKKKKDSSASSTSDAD